MSEPERTELGLADLASVDRAVRKESYEWGLARGRIEAARLEAIVRDLAAREPLAQLGDTPYHDCSLCGAHNDPPGQPYTNTPPAVIHDEACPHRRAKEWVEAQHV